jgi:hypothetical protein
VDVNHLRRGIIGHRRPEFRKRRERVFGGDLSGQMKDDAAGGLADRSDLHPRLLALDVDGGDFCQPTYGSLADSPMIKLGKQMVGG